MAFGATAANAGITIPAGDWTIDIGGNVNAYYTNTKFDGDAQVYRRLTGDGSGPYTRVSNTDLYPNEDRANTISTGLLPAALGIGGKTRQNDLDIAFQFTFFTGVDSGCALGSVAGGFNSEATACGNGAGGANSLNIRQAYMTFGDASWGTIKMGRDLGIYGSDAILNDMTLLGVGIGAGGGGSSTLGRIGSGYMYADWKGQISYTSPNWNGFSFSAGVMEPWTNGYSNKGDNLRNDLGFEAKASYEWTGDVAGKVWVGGISQKHKNDVGGYESPEIYGTMTAWWDVEVSDAEWSAAADDSYTARGWEVGGKVAFGGLQLVGNYYDGKGLGRGLTYLTAFGDKTDDDGWYVQATYTIPGWGTKIGASYGEANTDAKITGADFGYKNKYEEDSWIVGVYHPLTKSLNLVVEYTQRDIQSDFSAYETQVIDSDYYGKSDSDIKTLSLGAILFF